MPGLIKPAQWGWTPAFVDPKWSWFWSKSHAVWPLWEIGGGKTFSIGNERIEGELKADARRTNTRFGLGLDPASGPTDPRVTVPDNSRFVFTNDFSITVVFFDDGVTPAGGIKDFCGKVSADFDDYEFYYDHNAQQISWDGGGTALKDNTIGDGGLDYLHGILSTITVVKHPARGKEIWHNGDLLASDATTDPLTGGANEFALLARGDATTPWDNGPIYGIYFHQPALTGGEQAILSADPFGPFRMLDEVGVVVGVAAGVNTEAITATATGVPAIQLQVSKVLAATAIANPAVTRKTFKTLTTSAVGIAALVDIPTFRIALAATASGIAGLLKKARLGLSNTAVVAVTLAKKARFGLSVSAAGLAVLARKSKITLRNTATGVVAIVVNALEGATLLTLAVTATAIAALNMTVKKSLQAVSVGIATLDPIATFRVLLTAVGAGVATLTKVATFRRAFAATATGLAALSKKPKLGLAATATGIVSINRTIFKTLRASAQGLAAVVLVAAVFIAIAVAAVGIPAIALKIKRGLNAVGSGVANIQRYVRKTLRVFAVGIPDLNEQGPTIAEKLKTRIIGFFGGPGQGPGR